MEPELESFVLRDYQEEAHSKLIKRKRALLLADPGKGKTGTILSVTNSLGLFDDRRWMIFAPPKVALTVWPSHFEQFDEFNHPYTLVNQAYKPTRAKRLQDPSYRYYVTNTAMVKWLQDQNLEHIDGIIIDEIDKFAGRKALFEYMTNLLSKWKFKYVYGMTGTPCSNSLEQLWPQMYFIDAGRSLGPNITAFRTEYCGRADMFWKYPPLPGSLEKITKKIAPYCATMEGGIDETTVNDVQVQMHPTAKKDYYNRCKRKDWFGKDESKMLLDDAGRVYQKLKQMTSGGYYYDEEDPTKFETIHLDKVEALKDLWSELGKKKILVFYWYKLTKHLLQEAFKAKSIKKFWLDADTNDKKIPKFLDDWKADKYDICFSQPASAGHGVDGLQYGCYHVIWVDIPESLALYEQGNGRVAGARAQGPVTVHRLVMEDSPDEVNIERLAGKHFTQREVFRRLGIEGE